MAKFNITVDLDWLDEEGNIDDIMKDAITTNVVASVSSSSSKMIESAVQEKVNEHMLNVDKTINKRLNELMEDFFTTPKDITDKYGDVVEKGVTIQEKMKKACDDFMSQPLDKYGKPTKGYDVKYPDRVSYFVANAVDANMEYNIKKAVEDVTKNLKNRIGDAIRSQLGEKLGELTGVADILSKL